jgi:predicted MFS family arabinose efflux permease
MRDTLASPGPWLLAALFTAFTAAYFAVFGFLPQLLQEQLGMDPKTASLLAGIAVAASALGNLLCGPLLTRGVPRPVILTSSFAVMALAGFGILGGQALATSYAACLLFAVVSGLIPVALLDAAGRYAPRPELVGATIGFMMQGNSAGLVLGPAAAGAIATGLGWPAVAVQVAVMAGIGAGLVAALRLVVVTPARARIPTQT